MKTSSLKIVAIFLSLNFGALFLGGLFTSSGVQSDWYASLNQAPWTPPGWLFGFAWTTIMICFTFYMTYLLNRSANKKPILILFTIQWCLNILWNLTFFYFQQIGLGLLLILLLTILVSYMLSYYSNMVKKISILMAPYLIWLLVASSLNIYLFYFN